MVYIFNRINSSESSKYRFITGFSLYPLFYRILIVFMKENRLYLADFSGEGYYMSSEIFINQFSDLLPMVLFTAFSIFRYPVQRQRFPERAVRISSFDGCGFSVRSA